MSTPENMTEENVTKVVARHLSCDWSESSGAMGNLSGPGNRF